MLLPKASTDDKRSPLALPSSSDHGHGDGNFRRDSPRHLGPATPATEAWLNEKPLHILDRATLPDAGT